MVDSLLGLPLHESIHVDEVEGPDFHGLGPLFGPDTDRISMTRNVLAHHFGRNPLSRTDGLVMINNYVYNWRGEATVLGSVDGSINRGTVVGNLYVKGPNSNARPPIRVTDMPTGSSVFVDGNDGPGADSNPWTIVENLVGDWVVASSPPVVYDGYGPDAVATVPAILDTVGAWPSARDAVDQRIIQEVGDGSGVIINCVEDDGSERCSLNAGGWPTLEENHRVLTLPADPNGDDNGDGYTNLENWLHAFDP